MSVCNYNINFEVIIQYREWIDVNKYGKLKFMEVKKHLNKEGEKKLKVLTNISNINSDDVNIINGFKKPGADKDIRKLKTLDKFIINGSII